jgi:hypothetical protein
MDLRLLPVFGALALFVVGCGPTPIAYHSTASVPYYTSSTSTQMKAVERKEDDAGKSYVVFAALDNESTGYVLVAPTGASSSGSNFHSADFNRAVPLKGENLTSLIEGLGGAIGRWGTESEGSGSFYEFVHAPENDIERVSENVVQYYASVRFTISRTESGPVGRLVLGASPEEQLQSVIEMEDKEEVQTFRNLLMRAQKRAGKMEG